MLAKTMLPNQAKTLNGGEKGHIYGWERHLDESTDESVSCMWMETFEAVKKVEGWSRFAWLLVAHLLHPACRLSLRARHNPVTVLESRLDRSGIAQEVVALHYDLLAWQDLQFARERLGQHNWPNISPAGRRM